MGYLHGTNESRAPEPSDEKRREATARRCPEGLAMKVTRVIVAAILIAAAAMGIGFAVNALRPQEQRLPLLRQRSMAPQVGLEWAKPEYDRGVAVFVDARNRGEYEWEHIPRARETAKSTV